MPRIDDLLNQLGGSKFFTSLNLASGYWQILIDPEDRHKTAFRTNRGLYEFKSMAFGLSDAPSTFQRVVNVIFSDLIDKKVLVVYLDDILIHTQTWSEHIEVVAEVFRRLQTYNLKIQFKKCKWAKSSLKFLGFIISADGIKMDPAKVLAIDSFPKPMNVKQLQRFLGLLNFSGKFVDSLASIASPLYELFQKKKKFVWTEAHQTAFNGLKQMIKRDISLQHPDFSKPFLLRTDASNAGLGAVLL